MCCVCLTLDSLTEPHICIVYSVLYVLVWKKRLCKARKPFQQFDPHNCSILARIGSLESVTSTHLQWQSPTEHRIRPHVMYISSLLGQNHLSITGQASCLGPRCTVTHAHRSLLFNGFSSMYSSLLMNLSKTFSSMFILLPVPIR